MDAFGDSDFTIRFLSLVFSLLAIVFFFDAVRHAHNERIALAACLIMALATPQIRYTQEARQYTMGMMLELIGLCAIIRMERFGVTRARLWALGISVFAMMVTHYFCFPICLAMGLYCLVVFRGAERRRVIELFIATAIIFTCVWGPFFWYQRAQFQHSEYYWANDLTPGHYGRILFYSALAPLRLILEPRQSDQKFAILSAVIFVIPFFLFRRNPRMLLWGLLVLLPVLFFDVLDLKRGELNIAQVRYLIFSSPAVFAIFASLLANQRLAILRWALPAIACFGAAISVPIGYFQKMDPKPVAAYLDTQLRGDEPVVFAGGSWGPYYTGLPYLGIARYSQKFPRPIAFLDGPATPELVRQLRKYPRIWVMFAGTEGVEGYLPGAVMDSDKRFFLVGWLRSFHWPPAPTNLKHEKS
jgi:uncharacterized membrane protein